MDIKNNKQALGKSAGEIINLVGVTISTFFSFERALTGAIKSPSHVTQNKERLNKKQSYQLVAYIYLLYLVQVKLTFCLDKALQITVRLVTKLCGLVRYKV